jgi:hypothetical protein
MLTSDKNVVVYDRIGPPDKAIVLHRDPVAWCTSWVVNAGRAEGRYGDNELPRLPDLKVDRACEQYIMQYSRIFDWLKQSDLPYIVISMDQLIDQPRTWVQWICDRLAITFDPNALDVSGRNPVHTVGGNPAVVFGRAPKVLQADMKWQQILTYAQYSKVTEETHSSPIYARLMHETDILMTDWRHA